MKRIQLALVLTAALFYTAFAGLIVNARLQMPAFSSELVSKRSESRLELIEYTQQFRLTSGMPGDNFAGEVKISGNTAIVGSSTGVFVYVRSGATWIQQAILLPGPAAIDGDTIVIGGSNTSIPPGQFQGAAYVFVRNGTTWTEQQRLVASDGIDGDGLGSSVAIDGDTIVVGATMADVGSNVNQGSAYVFVRSGNIWSQQARLNASIPASSFGRKVAIDSNTVAVANGFGLTSSVYLFVRNGASWTEQQRIAVCEPSGPSPGNVCAFGKDISISGDTLAVTNDWLNVNANQIQGGTYIFVRNGTVWSQEQKITASEGLAGDHYGYSVSVSGDSLVVGGHGNGVRPGAAYIYERAGSIWTLVQPRLQITPTPINNLFGWDVDVNGSNILVGVTRDLTPPEGAVGAAYLYSNATVLPTVVSPFDFDGDSKTDLSIFRPNGSNGAEWWWLKSSNGGNGAATFGAATDMIVPSDYTGDGKADIAVWRPSNGNWFVLRSEDSSFFAFPFGTSGDVPVPADFDGDGKADAAVFRESAATWYISKSSGGTDIVGFGAVGDKPVNADYDGDGKSDIAIFRPNGVSGAEWWVRRSSNAAVVALQFGTSIDKAVAGDYTGDGKADVAFWQPTTGFWNILRSEDSSYYAFPFGANGDFPTPGDYDGDGKTDAAIFRPSNSTWFAQRSTAGTLIQQFGQAGDVPVPNAFVR